MEKNTLYDLVTKKIGKFIDKISDSNISKEERVMDKLEKKQEAAPTKGTEEKVITAATKLPETTVELLDGDKVYSAEADKVAKDVAKIETTKELSDHNKFDLDGKKAGALPETTVELLNGDKALGDESKKVEKGVSKLETTKELSEHNAYNLDASQKAELKTVLDKLSAFEYMNLMETIQKKSKNDVKDIERHTDKEYASGVKSQTDNKEPGLDSSVSKGHDAIEKGTLKVADKVEDLQRHDKSEYNKPNVTVEDGLESKVEKGHEAIEKGTLKVADKKETSFPEKADGEEALAKTKKDIMERVKAELEKGLASRLYTHNLKRTLAKVVSETIKDEAGAKSMFEELTKAASLVLEAGKDYYYYFNGQKAPKSVDLPFAGGQNRDTEFAGDDVTKVKEGTQTPTELKDKGDKKDEYSSATDKVKKEKENLNTVMETRKKMHFTASFDKGEKLSKESAWTVTDEEGTVVLKATMENIWQGDVEKELPAFENPEHVTKYKEVLESRLNEEGETQVATLLGTVVTAKSKKSKEKEVLKLVEEVENAVGIQEAPEHDEKEKDLPFLDHVLEEMKELHKHFVKPSEAPKEEHKEPKKENPFAKKEEPKKEEPKKEEKTFTGTEPAADTTPKVDAPAPGTTASLESDASIFDKQEVMLGEGIMAIKDKASKMIAIRDKDGKELGKYPDGFGDDSASVIQLLRAVLKVDKKKEEPKKEEKLSSKSDKEIQLEAEIAQLRTEAAIKEKTMRCRALIEEMLTKGLIQPNEDHVEASQKDGKNIFDAKKESLMKSVEEQMTEFFKMDKSAFDAFERSIKKIQKKAAQTNVLTQAPNLVTDPSKLLGQTDEEWLRGLPWS